MPRILPPQLVVLLIVVAVVLGAVAPVAVLLGGRLRLIGVVPVIAGLSLTLGCASVFERRSTNIHTFRDPDVLVVDGAYRWTRNPMYLGFATILVGVAISAGSLSAWLAPVVFVLVADRWYIRFEEAKMTERFGAAYVDYRTRTRRWIGRR